MYAILTCLSWSCVQARYEASVEPLKKEIVGLGMRSALAKTHQADLRNTHVLIVDRGTSPSLREAMPGSSAWVSAKQEKANNAVEFQRLWEEFTTKHNLSTAASFEVFTFGSPLICCPDMRCPKCMGL